jgi:hypothetical protein
MSLGIDNSKARPDQISESLSDDYSAPKSFVERTLTNIEVCSSLRATN